MSSVIVSGDLCQDLMHLVNTSWVGHAKATLEIVLVDLLECHEYLRNSSVHEVIDCRETYLATQC
jgi:hypothetical protein